jgi:hypothetical protein
MNFLDEIESELIDIIFKADLFLKTKNVKKNMIKILI